MSKLKGGEPSRQDSLIKELLSWKPDLIINNTIMNGEILDKLKIHSCPVLSIIHELGSFSNYIEQKNETVSKTLITSDQLAVVSEAVKKDIEARLKKLSISRKMDIIPGFSSLHRNSSLQKQTGDTFIVGASGSLIFRKGPDQFIRIAHEVFKQQPNSNIHFHWLGGDLNSLFYFELMEEVKKYKLENKITFSGSTDDPLPIFQSFHLFCMTSREDPFPLVNMEVAQLGIPILSSKNSGGTSEFLKEESEFLVPYGDCEAFANKILELVNNREVYSEQSNWIVNRGQEFNAEKILLQWQGLFDDLLNE